MNDYWLVLMKAINGYCLLLMKAINEWLLATAYEID